jgi:hypothetical protein
VTDLTKPLIVTTKHVFSVPLHGVRPGHCRAGAKAWFAAHGIDWRGFVRDGIAAQQLLATGDAFALEVVEWARAMESKAMEASDGRQE